MYGHRQHPPESGRGKDPSGHDRAGMMHGRSNNNNSSSRTTYSSRSTPKNILDELQDIEHALSMVSSHSTMVSHNYNTSRVHPPASQDWHTRTTPPTSTPPRTHSNYIDRNPSSHSTAASRDPPLSNNHVTPSQQKKSNNGNYPRSPLVRFSEQLEVYSKHISQGCSNTPTVPILRSKGSSGSLSKRVHSTDIPNESSNSFDILPPSGGSRDPTPRAAAGDQHGRPHSSQQVPREPAGITTTTHTATSIPSPTCGKAMSDPPIDRSRRLLMSPAANTTRPPTSHQTASLGRYQVRQGALSLQEQNTNTSYNMSSILGGNYNNNNNTISRGASVSRSNSDMELNPRRLYSQLENTHQSQSTSLLPKQDLAPTPRNREQAPTPNNKRGGTATANSSTWNIAALFSNPCQSPLVTSRPTEVPPFPSIQIQENCSTTSVPGVLHIPKTSSASTRIAPSTNEHAHPEAAQVAFPDDGASLSGESATSSTESATAMLMSSFRQATKDQWEKVPTWKIDSSSDAGEDDSFCSEKTPSSSTHEMLERNAPLSDSKIYSKPKRRTKRVATTTATKKMSYLQLGDDGSLQQMNVGTEVMALPKSIEVRLEESTCHEKQPQELGNDCFGKALHRFRSNSSQGDEDELVSIEEQNDMGILKKSTSETEDTDSGIHFPRMTSGWDRFERDVDSDCGDNEILITSSSKKRRVRKQSRLWILWVLVCAVIICLSGGLPVYFYMTSQPTESSADVTVVDLETTSPNSTFQQYPSVPLDFDNCILLNGDLPSVYSQRYQTIRQYLRLLSVGRTAMVDQPETPQRKALCWLAEYDPYQIDVGVATRAAIIQRYSLAVLYFSLASTDLVSENILLNSNFLSAQHECTWDAIMCSRPGVVSALLLSDKNLRGELPAEIGNLQGLSFLELSLNQITGTIPITIQQLAALQYLGMSFNELTGTVPSELGRLRNLQYLNLRSSQVRGTIPAELGNLSNLESLLLEGNLLSGTIPSALGNLILSRSMSFRRNYLSGRVALELCELRHVGNLQELTVDDWIACDCCTST
ncbi:leucine rich repeat LRR-containing protein [Nitzschia inconspicua]|uniref:Leucine rich repeat LRR-containing protein n=1 Tax=Nitzschia inconspicua TaxID=303405 RepID=A0A9K3PWD2_9STRA|nr:leucine rich repeat LRR-containing protein [Nitzschia inconspicua]